MILKNNFYQIQSIEKSATGLKSRLLLNKSHAIFDGHFPNNPVTPGVVEMEMVKEMVGEFLGKTAALKKMSTCKLLAILSPVEFQEINIILDCSPSEEGLLKVNAQIQCDEKVFLNMTAFYH